MSVKGAANSKLESLSVGMLDVFSSAFWTHPAYAHSVIRNCDEELQFSAKAAGVRIFQPPRSMDVVYNMFAVVDLPGLINVATVAGTDYEVTSKCQRARTYKATIAMEEFTYGNNQITAQTITGADDATTALISALAGALALRAVTSDGTKFYIAQLNAPVPLAYFKPRPAFNGGEGLTSIGQGLLQGQGDYACYLWDAAGNAVANNDPACPSLNPLTVGEIEFTLWGVEETFVDVTPDQPTTLTIQGSGYVYGDQPHYVDAVGQYLVQDVEMTIGGARVGLINSMYMYIHEELFGHPGRRQEEMIGKVNTGLYEPEDKEGAGIDELRLKSMSARRLYIQLPFWWTGGKMERALKTIALQLHKIEFKVQTRKLEDCIAWGGSNLSGSNVPSAGTIHAIVTSDSYDAAALTGTTKTTVRLNENISPSANDHLIGAVRKNAGGGDVAMSQRLGGNGLAASTASDADNIKAYLQVDFAGIFLNQTTRDTYLKLDEKTLFTQILGTDTDGIALDNTKTAPQTQTLNLSNAVADIMVAVQSVEAGKEFGDTFGLRGTSRDAVTGMRDDALKTLSFDISSTPRTIAGLSADYYRHITQYQSTKCKSELKGLYYYNVALFDELNGTRCVNSFINASKIDDLRARFHVNDGPYSKETVAAPTPENSAATEDVYRQLLKEGKSGCKIFFYAHVYNTIQFRNGMAGAMFA